MDRLQSMMASTPNQPDLPELPTFGGVTYVFRDLYRFGSSDTAQLTLTTIGGFFAVYWLLQIIDWLLGVVQSPQLAKYRHAGDDSWAVVTGATDGIGKGFSEELLRRGHNVLLHGRNQQKLEKIKKELLEQWPKRQVDVVAADASKYDKAYEVVVKKAKSLPGKVTILVNNVGGQITTPRNVALGNSKHDDLDTCLNINARFPTHLTASMILMLQENSPSLIINSGSMGGTLGCPYLLTYTATKAYIHTFTNSLRIEMIAEGTPDVEVKGFMIGNTETTGNPQLMPFFTLQPRDTAASCLDRVGKAGGAVVFSHWRHALQYKIMTLMPASFMDKEMIKEMRRRQQVEQQQLGSAKKDV